MDNSLHLVLYWTRDTRQENTLKTTFKWLQITKQAQRKPTYCLEHNALVWIQRNPIKMLGGKIEMYENRAGQKKF